MNGVLRQIGTFSRVSIVLSIATLLSGCSQLYYEFWEGFGKEKRDLLQDNVEEVVEDQTEVGEEFQDALTMIRALYGLEGGKLEERYGELRDQYESAKEAAANLTDRIEQVEDIGEDLFKEWRDEAQGITSATLKRDSLRKLEDTKAKFVELKRDLRRSEASMAPVLAKLRDQVLYLKHNLNARALGSLKSEAAAIEREIDGLIKEMQSSIAASKSFVKSLQTKEVPST